MNELKTLDSSTWQHSWMKRVSCAVSCRWCRWRRGGSCSRCRRSRPTCQCGQCLGGRGGDWEGSECWSLFSSHWVCRYLQHIDIMSVEIYSAVHCINIDSPWIILSLTILSIRVHSYNKQWKHVNLHLDQSSICFSNQIKLFEELMWNAFS